MPILVDLQIFQKREDGSEDFARSYAEYEEGFGNATGEYWLGKY
jgi:ficolin